MKNSLPDLFNKYGGFFKTHGIRGKNEVRLTVLKFVGFLFFVGRTLFMLNDNLLLEMGINDAQDR